MQKPSIPKGTRDFGPEQMVKRNFILNNIKEVFQSYGFAQLETPTMENLSVLTGKYGDEGDQLLFKVLNSGDYLSRASAQDYESGSKQLTNKISDKGLRYDLTVPFARYVVMRQNDITFPFKRYQIQPVWRADRPQRGRYREFYQCDADIVGSNSLINEAEIILLINDVFQKLHVEEYAIKINNRKILNGLVEVLGAEDKTTEFLVAIDKLDKIGIDKVCEELESVGFNQSQVATSKSIFSISGRNLAQLNKLKEVLKESDLALTGINEMLEVLSTSDEIRPGNKRVEFDITLARGLSYYTGTIFEVKPTSVKMGSICGGGRYDDLTGIFGLQGVSGVGISFGVDRIYDVMEEIGLLDELAVSQVDVIIGSFGESTLGSSLRLLDELRKAGLKAELYPDIVKLKKQFNYADKKSIPFVIIQGEEELVNNEFGLKDMKTGNQTKLTKGALLDELKNKLSKR